MRRALSSPRTTLHTQHGRTAPRPCISYTPPPPLQPAGGATTRCGCRRWSMRGQACAPRSSVATRRGPRRGDVPPPALCRSARYGLLRPTNRRLAAAAAAARSDGGTERSGWGSIATSHALNGQGDGEQRAQADFWAWYAAWSRRALRRPCAPPSWRSALRSAAGRRLRSTGGTTTFLSSSSSSFSLFMRILFSNRALRDFVLFQVHSVLCHDPLSFGPQDSLEMFSNLTGMK